MPKLNPYLIENKAQVEEIREIKNETPSFDEFMKTYESDEDIINSYNTEFKSYDDIGVGKGYGPGRRGCDKFATTGRIVLMMDEMWSRDKEHKEFEEKIERLETSLKRVERELGETKSQYRRGEIANYRLKEIIREKEEKIRELERENREISQESGTRRGIIERLELEVREFKYHIEHYNRGRDWDSTCGICKG